MENTLPVIDYIRYCDDMWTNASDGSFIIGVKADAGYIPCFKLPAEVLARKHPNLPQAIRDLIDWNSFEGGDGFANFKSVYATIEYTRGNTLEFLDTSGTFRVMSQVRIFETDNTHKVATITGVPLVLRQKENAVGGVVFTDSNNKPQTIAVSYDELSKNYPGWETRWALGKELDMSLQDLLPTVFIKAGAGNVEADVDSLIFE